MKRLLAIYLLLTGLASGQMLTNIWCGQTNNASWGNAAQWSQGVVPTNGHIAWFGTNAIGGVIGSNRSCYVDLVATADQYVQTNGFLSTNVVAAPLTLSNKFAVLSGQVSNLTTITLTALTNNSVQIASVANTLRDSGTFVMMNHGTITDGSVGGYNVFNAINGATNGNVVNIGNYVLVRRLYGNGGTFSMGYLGMPLTRPVETPLVNLSGRTTFLCGYTAYILPNSNVTTVILPSNAYFSSFSLGGAPVVGGNVDYLFDGGYFTNYPSGYSLYLGGGWGNWGSLTPGAGAANTNGCTLWLTNSINGFISYLTVGSGVAVNGNKASVVSSNNYVTLSYPNFSSGTLDIRSGKVSLQNVGTLGAGCILLASNSVLVLTNSVGISSIVDAAPSLHVWGVVSNLCYASLSDNLRQALVCDALYMHTPQGSMSSGSGGFNITTGTITVDSGGRLYLTNNTTIINSAINNVGTGQFITQSGGGGGTIQFGTTATPATSNITNFYNLVCTTPGKQVTLTNAKVVVSGVLSSIGTAQSNVTWTGNASITLSHKAWLMFTSPFISFVGGMQAEIWDAAAGTNRLNNGDYFPR